MGDDRCRELYAIAQSVHDKKHELNPLMYLSARELIRKIKVLLKIVNSE